MELIRKIKIGSAADNDLIINNEQVGAYHLELIHDQHGNVFIADLNSFNGTFLNNVKVEGFSQIYWGDKVTIAGKFWFDWMKLINDNKLESPHLNNGSEIVYSELSNKKVTIPILETMTSFNLEKNKLNEDDEYDNDEDMFIEHSNPVIQFYLNNSQIVNIFLLNLILSILFYFAFLT
jgi:hypothetical protein